VVEEVEAETTEQDGFTRRNDREIKVSWVARWEITKCILCRVAGKRLEFRVGSQRKVSLSQDNRRKT
jgi:hypothetical protein